VSAATLRKVERASAGLATRAVAQMDERLPWFRVVPADQRSWVTLVAQAGISGYISWATGASTSARLTEQVFGTAPRDLTRSVSFRRTVELVRLAISVADEHLPALGDTEAERAALELAEQGTRIADAAGGVTDDAWANAARHYDDDQLVALVAVIALINTYNRIIQQPAGDYQAGQWG